MKVSRNWLQTYFKDPLPDAAALADALTFHVFEIDGIEKMGSDDVLDVKVTANRGHDCLSHRGIAKELSAILNVPLIQDALRQAVSLEPKTDAISVEIQDPALCNRYIAGYIKGVKVEPSPEWLRTSLEAIGQRSINNIVDATNYVMFGLGQPLHAFDANKLTKKEERFSIRVATTFTAPHEAFTALDGKGYLLPKGTLAITDGNTLRSIGIAGVKGGVEASVTSETADIILESANFNGASVRKVSQALKLRTDASSRFEQVLSPELAAYGMHAVVELITQLAGGEVIGFVDEYPIEPQKVQVSISTSRINAVLGSTLKDADVIDALRRIGLSSVQEGEVFTVHVPFERLDITIPEDLIEEVGRVIGYDKIPNTELPPLPNLPEINKNFYWAEKIREFLISQGFSEIYTSVFVDRGQFEERIVSNKIDGERSYLRGSLNGELKESLKKNIRNKDLLRLSQIRLFEVGTVWRLGGEFIVLGLAVEELKNEKTASDFMRALMESFGITPPTALSNTPAGALLEMKIDDLVHGLKEQAQYPPFGLSMTIRYQTFSKYPFIVRDIALWVPTGTNADDVLATIQGNAGELLVRCEKFDEFVKGEKTSYAFRLVFQSFEKTLTDAEVNAIMEDVSVTLRAKGFEIR